MNLVIFDLDGTLSISKTPMDSEMATLIVELLKINEVAVISGGSFDQFQKQFIGSLDAPQDLLKRLYLFPTCATSFYRYDGNNWKPVYKHSLTTEEKSKIKTEFQAALLNTKYIAPTKIFGNVIEDRETQITFSALGQEAPIQLKEAWDPNRKKRQTIVRVLERYLPEFEVRIGGTTSIDVTRKGIDKKYGIEQIEHHRFVPKQKMLFVGDALFPGGNDWPVQESGVRCIAVSGPEETKQIIRALIVGDG